MGASLALLSAPPKKVEYYFHQNLLLRLLVSIQVFYSLLKYNLFWFCFRYQILTLLLKKNLIQTSLAPQTTLPLPLSSHQTQWSWVNLAERLLSSNAESSTLGTGGWCGGRGSMCWPPATLCCRQTPGSVWRGTMGWTSSAFETSPNMMLESMSVRWAWTSLFYAQP